MGNPEIRAFKAKNLQIPDPRTFKGPFDGESGNQTFLGPKTSKFRIPAPSKDHLMGNPEISDFGAQNIQIPDART